MVNEVNKQNSRFLEFDMTIFAVTLTGHGFFSFIWMCFNLFCLFHSTSNNIKCIDFKNRFSLYLSSHTFVEQTSILYPLIALEIDIKIHTFSQFLFLCQVVCESTVGLNKKIDLMNETIAPIPFDADGLAGIGTWLVELEAFETFRQNLTRDS